MHAVTQAEKQIDIHVKKARRQTGKQAGNRTANQTSRHTCRQTAMQGVKQPGIRAVIHAGRQTDILTNRQAGKKASRHTQ